MHLLQLYSSPVLEICSSVTVFTPAIAAGVFADLINVVA
jgi:hypothetical protein